MTFKERKLMRDLFFTMFFSMMCLSTFAKWGIVTDTDERTGNVQFLCVNVSEASFERRSATSEYYRFNFDEYKDNPSLVVKLTPTSYDEDTETMMGMQDLMVLFYPFSTKRSVSKFKITLDGTDFVVNGETGNNRYGVFLPQHMIGKILNSKNMSLRFTEFCDTEVLIKFKTEGLNDTIKKIKNVVKKIRPKSVVFKNNSKTISTNRKD